jgi:hypothetical protein
MTETGSNDAEEGTDRLRLRRLVGQWFGAIVIVLLVVAAVGLGGIYTTHVAPGETTEERVLSTWSEQGEFRHGATVQRDTDAFPLSTELRNQPVYYTSVAPEVTVEHVGGYSASDSGRLDMSTTLELHWQGTDSDDNVLWEVTEPVATSRWSNVAPGETRSVATTLSPVALTNRIDRIHAEIGSTRGSADTILRARTTYVGTVNGEAVRETAVGTLPVDNRGDTYGFLEGDVGTKTHQRTVTETVPVVHGPVRSAGVGVLFGLPLIGLAALGVGHRRGRFRLTAAETARLEYALAREEFDEWITPGTLPPAVSRRTAVELSSLDGIVNVAIDSGRRVIQDGYRFVLTTPELTYVYVADLPGAVPPALTDGTERTDSADADSGGPRDVDTTAQPAETSVWRPTPMSLDDRSNTDQPAGDD